MIESAFIFWKDTMKHLIRYSLIPIFLLVILSTWWISSKPPQKLVLKNVAFNALPNWNASDTRKSFAAFQISCKAFLKQNPEKMVGSDFIHLQIKDWLPACQSLSTINPASKDQTKSFFESWFEPVEFDDGKPVRGLFTGYYMPAIKGSLTRTDEFKVPIYGVPSNLITADVHDFDKKAPHKRIVGRVVGKKLVPYFTRKQINNGAIQNVAPVLAWIHSPVDRVFLEIEGSGIIDINNEKPLFVGYSAENGAPYTSIARVLIDKGAMTKDTASMQTIIHYFKSHPNRVDSVINQNQSFVFFQTSKQEAALGSQGVPLTPGYSLAVDRKWIPMGTPIWLNTTRPDHQSDNNKPFTRLMIAQDTGGAIRGSVRGDVYWGPGEKAQSIAGRMKNTGHYWLLLPKH